MGHRAAIITTTRSQANPDGTMYSMMSKTGDVFNSADMRSAEVLWSYQFSENMGGGGTGTPLMGHRAAIITTTRSQANPD
jgi:hypothetical protein